MALPIPEKRISDFEDLGFGMFIHWGLYSQLGKGEWVQAIPGIPKEEYRKLKDTFTASGFDAKKIAKLAKKAGMKYITLTTRHHDGFSLYDTCGLNDYDAPNSPAKRDLIKEFVDACKEEGIVPFFYHTTLDWYNEDFDKDFDTYLEYLRKSVEILCTNYGEIGGLWFDGNWSKPNNDWKLDDLYGTIRKHQPNALIINNTGLEAGGKISHKEIDSVTFEQGLPHQLDREGMEKYVSGEMCCTINDHWGYGHSDFNYKSVSELIKTLCACRKVGANLLLNIGPDGDGAIPLMMEATLSCLGDYINLIGDVIYKGRPGAIEGDGKNFVLDAPNGKKYMFVFDLPIIGDENVTVGKKVAKPISFTNAKEKISYIKWLDNDRELVFTQNEESGLLSVIPTGYTYGTNYIVRVAEMG